MEKLVIALQKSGRLQEGSLKLLRDCGFKVDYREGQLKVAAGGYPAELLFLRNSDIPEYVADGVADLGIVGSNLLQEIDSETEIVYPLGFSRCRVSFAVPKNSEIKTLSDLEGRKIATSYTNTVSKFLKENKIKADIHCISGSVEIAPSLGLADVIADIVSTGNTLFQNGLKEIFSFLDSEAVLIRGKNFNPQKQALMDELVFRMKSVRAAAENKYILLNAPKNNLENICRILPGMKSPTILPLADEGWCSVHSVIAQNNVWKLVSELKNEGAQGILIVPIEKMIS